MEELRNFLQVAGDPLWNSTVIKKRATLLEYATNALCFAFTASKEVEMETLIANRSFVYTGSTESIKFWLHKSGYLTEDILGENNVPIVFRIVGTGIKVGYHRPVHEYDTGKPKVHLLNDPTLVEDDPEAAQRGIHVYQELSKRFRERKSKPS